MIEQLDIHVVSALYLYERQALFCYDYVKNKVQVELIF